MAKLKDILAAFLCTVGDSGDVSSIFIYVNGLHLLAFSLNANSNILNEHSHNVNVTMLMFSGYHFDHVDCCVNCSH